MSNHSKLSPSSAHRWMNCAGALALEDGFPDTSSGYADEGTAAHFLASVSLNHGTDPHNNVGDYVVLWVQPSTGLTGQCFGNPDAQYTGAEITNSILVTDEMADAVQTYVDAIIDQTQYGFLKVEHRVWFSRHIDVPDQGGTADAIIVADNELQVHDLKYGRGVKVDAEENEQLMLYALGALDEFELFGDFKQVRLFIHQPRINHVSEWVADLGTLHAFAQRAKDAAMRALSCYLESSATIPQHLTPGDKQCKFCKAKAFCPALTSFVQDTVGISFESLPTEAPAVDVNTELSAKYSAIGLVKGWCDAVSAAAFAELNAGRTLPGYKLVAGKKGNRAWKEETEAEAAMKSMRLKTDEMYTYKVISPTTAEKLLKKDSPRKWAKLQPLITQGDGAHTIAPESDPRPAISLADEALDGFTNLDEEAA